MDLGLQGRVALITGSARGIGAETAHRFAEEGVSVVIADINGDAALGYAEELRGEGFQAHGVAGDITDPESAASIVDAAVEAFGALHIVVNNAGFSRDGPITAMTVDDWDQVFDIILKGSFLITRAAIPHLVEQQWGRVINISSRAYLGNAGQANYSAAKAGILGFTRALAREQAPYGITVNAVVPGTVETDGIRGLANFEQIRDSAIAGAPLGRLGMPEDIANAVVFLSSERAAYITGEALHVTGGRYG